MPLGRRGPLQYGYARLAGWNDELTDSITTISAHRDQLTTFGGENFRRILYTFRVSDELPRESLRDASAVLEHATRLRYVLEAHQMLHRITSSSEADAQYVYESQSNMPEPFNPNTYIESLRWWRDNYTNAFMLTAT